MALAFPDVYEIGMSHLGLKILYDVINARDGLYAERVFAPWPDMERVMRENKIPLKTLESKTPLQNLDLIGFSLQYELCATTVLQMLDLGGIPLRSALRSDGDPLVIAGGPVSLNPNPLSAFIDAFVMGDGEDVILEVACQCIHSKGKKESRRDLLERMKALEGVYVPLLHRQGDVIKKRVVADLDKAHFPTEIIVPFAETVHDRVGVEVARGCTRGCRFCQAGMVYRPVRERSQSTVTRLVKESLGSTGYDEVALLSLSTGDYSGISPLIKKLNEDLAPEMTAISLPSLRTDTFDAQMAEEIRKVRKTGFTLAPEAGSDRLRRIINKGNSEEDLEYALTKAFEYGWTAVKLYFMIGLPLETDTDLDGIVKLLRKAEKLSKGKKITAAVSCFVPKAHTPFQWAEQIGLNELERKQRYLKDSLYRSRVRLKFHSRKMSYLEGILARGDSRLCPVIETAYAKGARFDGWDDQLKFQLWLDALVENNVDPDEFLGPREIDHLLPWDFIDVGVSKDFLKEEWEKASYEAGTSDCRKGECSACGVCDFQEVYPRIGMMGNQEDLPAMSLRRPTSELVPRRFLLKYEKAGVMSLLGHHDVARAFLRAFRRAGLALDYSKGFHPHPKMRFSPPTGMGIQSLCEFVDFDLLDLTIDENALFGTLTASLPPGLRPTFLMETQLNEPAISAKIRYVTYEIDAANLISSETMEMRLRDFRNCESLEMTEMRKGRPRLRDLKSWITGLEKEAGKLLMTVRAGTQGSVNPREAARVILGISSEESKSLYIVKASVGLDQLSEA
jgi:radical SAM family uncharacterized protein/radical SAM-linked protein